MDLVVSWGIKYLGTKLKLAELIKAHRKRCAFFVHKKWMLSYQTNSKQITHQRGQTHSYRTPKGNSYDCSNHA